MDWTGCELVEVIEGKVSGAPLVVGTRLPAVVILSNFEAGSPIDEIAENYPGASIGNIRRLLAFARTHQLQREQLVERESNAPSEENLLLQSRMGVAL